MEVGVAAAEGGRGHGNLREVKGGPGEGAGTYKSEGECCRAVRRERRDLQVYKVNVAVRSGEGARDLQYVLRKRYFQD